MQAAYHAIRDSAKPTARTREYRETYFGAGVLQAADALRRGIPADLTPRPEAEIGFAWVDAILTFVGPADTGPDRLAASGPERERLHRDMFKGELAQLVFASARLQEIAGERHPDGLANDRTRRRAFLEAVRAEPACSQRLRAAIDRALSGA